MQLYSSVHIWCGEHMSSCTETFSMSSLLQYYTHVSEVVVMPIKYEEKFDYCTVHIMACLRTEYCSITVYGDMH